MEGEAETFAERGLRVLRFLSERTPELTDPQLLDEAIADLTRAVDLTPDVDPARPSRLSNLAAALRYRDHDGDLIVARARLTEAAKASDDPHSVAYLANLVTVTTLLADRTGAHDDLTAAIDALERLLAITQPGDPARARRLAMLGATLRRRFASGGDQADLSTAIRTLHEAVDAAGQTVRLGCLAELGHALLLAGEHDQAIDALREACAADSAIPPAYLANLGSALLARGRGHQDRIEDLTEAVISLDAAVQLAPRHPAFLTVLADALSARYELTWAPADRARAGSTARQAVEGSRSAQVLAVAGDVLARTVDPAAAIPLLEEALAGTPATSAQYISRQAMLAGALQRRAEATGDVADLLRAEKLLRHARAADSDRASANLGVVLTRIAESTGDLERLSEAVTLAHEAVACSAAGDPGRSARLGNLAAALDLAAIRTGSSAALADAVAAAEAAVAAAADPARRAVALATLGPILQTRHLWSNAGADLDTAISALRDAVAATPDLHPDRIGRLSNLGNALRFRGVWSYRRADLNEAVNVLTTAVRLASAGDAKRPGLLSNLAAALQSRAADRTDIDTATRLLREALSASPQTAPYRPRYLSNLGNALLSGGDAAAAVATQREALALLPPGHLDHSVLQGNLANALIALADQNSDDNLLRQALEAVTTGAADRAGNPQDQIMLLWRRAALLIQLAGDDAAAGLNAMIEATGLAEAAAWVGVAPADRERALIRFATLAQDASACAVAANRSDIAVAQLEAGRSIGWRIKLQDRSVDDLAVLYPGLAERLRAVGRARVQAR